MRIVVCPAAHLAAISGDVRPGLILSMHAPGRSPPPLRHGIRQAAFAFHDIAEPRAALTAPDHPTVAAILRAGAEAHGCLVVSCEFGVSRSPAVAFALACQAQPSVSADAIAGALRAASPCATPNPLVVALADDILGRDGSMAAAIARIRRGAEYRPYRSFTLETPPSPRR